MELNDSTLVQQSLNGDTDAFGALVNKYQNVVYGLAFHIVNNFADAQDIAQESFIEAYKNLANLREKSKFSNWLKSITTNVCKMWLRRQKEMIPIEKGEVAEMLEKRHVPPTPEEEYEAKEFRRNVIQAINSLPEKNRIVVTLYYLDGLSQKRIGDFLGISVTAVETRLYRAKKQLKEKMIKMVEQTLSEQKLSADFADEVIAELLAKPKPLENPEHPLRKVWEAAQASLPNYTVVEPGAEIESAQNNYILMGDSLDQYNVFHVDSGRMLRVHTTTALLNQLRKYKPPINLVTAGRVFRQCEESAIHYPVFHQIEGLCVSEDVTGEHLKEMIKKLARGILGDVKVRFRPTNFPFTDPGWEADVKVKGNWHEILGMGMFHKRILQEAGFDPEKVSGFGFGMGIERLAMIKYEIEDIRAFWRE